MPSRGMRIGIIGSGYVGTVTGAGLAELGNEVIFVDFDPERVAALNGGGIADLRTRAG
jgi:UDPglucose 6-dehydrogenase